MLYQLRWLFLIAEYAHLSDVRRYPRDGIRLMPRDVDLTWLAIWDDDVSLDEKEASLSRSRVRSDFHPSNHVTERVKEIVPKRTTRRNVKHDRAMTKF